MKRLKQRANRFRRKQERHGGRDRDRTDDLYRVKVALVPTELRAQDMGKILKARLAVNS